MDKTVEVSQAARDAGERAAREMLTDLIGARYSDTTLRVATDHLLSFARFEATTRATQPEAALREAVELARPIVEADLASAADYSDADWIGMSQTALDAIDAALKDHRHG